MKKQATRMLFINNLNFFMLKKLTAFFFQKATNMKIIKCLNKEI